MGDNQGDEWVGPAQRLRDTRRARGLSQEELARQVGVSRSAVAQWETARSGQLGVHLSRLARVLEVDVGWLLHGTPLAGSGDELALIRLYRECSDEDRQILLRMAHRLNRERK
jgi:transcriptional regulator with XRE-family HTH domain